MTDGGQRSPLPSQCPGVKVEMREGGRRRFKPSAMTEPSPRLGRPKRASHEAVALAWALPLQWHGQNRSAIKTKEGRYCGIPAPAMQSQFSIAFVNGLGALNDRSFKRSPGD